MEQPRPARDGPFRKSQIAALLPVALVALHYFPRSSFRSLLAKDEDRHASRSWPEPDGTRISQVALAKILINRQRWHQATSRSQSGRG